jgi:hypothetical protein
MILRLATHSAPSIPELKQEQELQLTLELKLQLELK